MSGSESHESHLSQASHKRVTRESQSHGNILLPLLLSKSVQGGGSKKSMFLKEALDIYRKQKPLIDIHTARLRPWQQVLMRMTTTLELWIHW